MIPEESAPSSFAESSISSCEKYTLLFNLSDNVRSEMFKASAKAFETQRPQQFSPLKQSNQTQAFYNIPSKFNIIELSINHYTPE